MSKKNFVCQQASILSFLAPINDLILLFIFISFTDLETENADDNLGQ